MCYEQSIEKRDNHPANPDEIFLCDGASAGVHLVMRSFIRGEQDAVLTPIPQYPLYSATLALNGGSLVPYYLDEDKGWQMDIEHLRSQVSQVCLRVPSMSLIMKVICLVHSASWFVSA